MALYTGNNEYAVAESTVTAIEGASTLTIAGWFRRNATSGGVFVSNVASTGGGSHGTALNLYTSPVCYLNARNGTTSTWGQFTSNTTQWIHLAYRYDGGEATPDDRVQCTLNGADQALSYTGTMPTSLSNDSSLEELNIGRHGAEETANGEVAELGIWNVRLSVAECAALANGFSPLLVRPDALTNYWDLVGGRYMDRVGGISMTTGGGTPSAVVHPRVIHPGGNTVGFDAAAAPPAGDVRPRFYHHRHHNQAA